MPCARRFAGSRLPLLAACAVALLCAPPAAPARADAFDANLDLYRKAARYQEKLAATPGDTATLRDLALVYGRLKLYDKALSCCVELVRLEPENARYVYDLGWAYHKMGRLEEASARYRAALELDPALESAAYNLSLARAAAADFAGAYEVAVAALPRHPDSPKLHLAGADAKLRGGDPAAARPLAERALALHPASYDARYLLLALAVKEGRTEEARLHYRAALEANPGARDEMLKDDDLRAFVREAGEK